MCLQVKRLNDRVDTLLAGRQSDVAQVVSLTTRIEELTAQLEASQTAYQSVIKKNAELTRMLHDIEDKGSKIGQLAKEKLTKLKGENEQLKAQLQAQQTDPDAGDTAARVPTDDVTSELATLRDDKQKLEATVAELQSKLDEKAAAFDSNQAVLKENTLEIGNLKEVIESMQSSTASAGNDLTQNLIQTKEQNASLKAQLDAVTSKTEQLTLKMEADARDWANQKAEFEASLATKTSELTQLRTELSSKLQVLDECENKMAAEKNVLCEQMAAQATEMDGLKSELTKLSSLLEQAGFYEVSSSL